MTKSFDASVDVKLSYGYSIGFITDSRSEPIQWNHACWNTDDGEPFWTEEEALLAATDYCLQHGCGSFTIHSRFIVKPHLYH